MLESLSAQFSAILAFGIILILGYIAGKVANLFRLPKVTGYILAGVLLEPSFFGILPKKLLEHSTQISNFALCVITYAIGGSLKFRRLRDLGKNILVMTLFESEIAFLLIAGGIFLAFPVIGRITGISVPATLYLPFAILAGALGSATDPTPTLAVKEEYKAEGPVTTSILGIGALDDALGIINFSIAIALAVVLSGGTGVGVEGALIDSLAKIVFSVILGIFFAVFLLFFGKKVEDKGVVVVLIMGALFTCFGMAQALELNELLSTMVLGCVVVNLAKDAEKYFMSIRDYFEEMIFIIFFVIAGANLDFGVLKSSVLIILVFVVMRVLGKVLGASIGGLISRASSNVTKYTPFGLIPQGGIVVGLALLVKQDPVFSDIYQILLNLILGTTVLFEFAGPLFTRFALKKAGELKKEV
ncbi:MAG: cation:proton antiporter [Candidatus Omnitrophota bacterium]|nr:cation:proton antiporter [Candidatus Omnitrophota bacterium]